MFVNRSRPSNVLFDLIQRTKDVVRELDNMIGSRFKVKLRIDAEHNDNHTDDSTVSCYAVSFISLFIIKFITFIL